MKNFIISLTAVHLLFFSFNPVLFSFQNSLLTSPKSSLEEKQSEYFNQAEKLKVQGDYEKSIDFFKKALSIARKNNDEISEVEALIKIGILYWNLGEVERSFGIHKEALSLAEKIRMTEKKEEIHNFMKIYELYQAGKESRSQGKYKESIENFEKAIELAREIKSEEYELKCLRQLGVTYWELNDFPQLFSLNQKALEIARRLNHKKEEGRCLYNIGLYYREIENYSQALRHYQEALRIARVLKDFGDESDCLTNVSDIYIQTGDYENALDDLREVLEIDKQLKNDAYVAIDMNNIGVTYRKKFLHSDNKADLDYALNYFEKSLEIARKIESVKTEIQILNNMGTAYTDKEDYGQALRRLGLGLEKAEEIKDAEEVANICINIGVVYSKKGKYDEAIKYFQKAIDKAAELNVEKILWEAYFERANAYKKLNNYQASLENYRKSISSIESIRSKIWEEQKASYLATDKRIEAYQNTVDLLCKLYKSEPEKPYGIEAFKYLERCKARAFLDNLEVSRVNISQGVDIELINQENELMKEISNLNAELLKGGLSPERKKNIDNQLKLYEEQHEALKREIRISSPAYVNIKYPEIISLEQAQNQMLDNQTAFFEYCLGKENSYAFVITKKKLKIFPLPSAEKIKTQVKEYLTCITDKDTQDFQLGYELFCTLILPGLEKKINKLIFIPDDILHYLPFETLISQKDKKRWLIEDYKIAYAPSISSLREIIEREKQGILNRQKDILIFGDPFFGPKEEEAQTEVKSPASSDSYNYRRLKYSVMEIDRIAALFKKKRIDIFKRKEATEEQLKKLNLSDYKILHFATHSLIDNEKPARSSIIFALGNTVTEDGFLQMREIFNLKLNADLVTLSACETGLGQLIKGEGIEGLSRAFFYAGASSAIISLWAVHDQASSQFMERYYHHLRSSKSIMDSLQKTKLEMIGSDTLCHPYYWAGFVTTGDSEKVISPSVNKKLIYAILFLFLAGGISSFIFLKKFKPSFLA